LEILRHFRNNSQVNLLEVGCYTGCSLVEILRQLPQATATVIDPWEDYDEKGEIMKNITKNGIEDMFIRNIKKSGLESRVTVYRGRSCDALPVLIENKKKYNFIYVDGSHKCLDAFLDCVLSWKLLTTDGILAVDDYTWGMNDPILDRPHDGVNHFLNLYKNEYRMLINNYRIFLLKLS